MVAWEGDGGDRESYSILYSHVVKAETESEARQKFTNATGDNAGDYCFVEITDQIYIS